MAAGENELHRHRDGSENARERRQLDDREREAGHQWGLWEEREVEEIGEKIY